jgi:hypothetical protein
MTKLTIAFRNFAKPPNDYTSVASSSSSFTGFYKTFAGFSLLILEVSRSHTRTQYSR